MIKINLVPARKVKRASEPGMKDVWIGGFAVLAAMAAVILFVHMPRKKELSQLSESNQIVRGELAVLREELKGYDELKKSAEAAQARGESIQALLAAKIVPANIL